MIYSAPISAFGIRLLAVTEEDAPFIIRQRRLPRARAFLGSTSTSVEVQREWIRSQRSRQKDYYFIIWGEKEERLGTIGLYNFANGSAEWGRFLVVEGAKAAPAALFALMSLGFEQFQLQSLFSTVLTKNLRARNFYDWAGLEQTQKIPPPIAIEGTLHAQIGHVVTQERWPLCQCTLAEAAAKHAPHLKGFQRRLLVSDRPEKR